MPFFMMKWSMRCILSSLVVNRDHISVVRVDSQWCPIPQTWSTCQKKDEIEGDFYVKDEVDIIFMLKNEI